MQSTRQFTTSSGFVQSLSNQLTVLLQGNATAYAIIDYNLNLVTYSQQAIKYLNLSKSAENMLEIIPAAFKTDFGDTLKKAVQTNACASTKTKKVINSFGDTSYLRMLVGPPSMAGEKAYLILFEEIELEDESAGNSQPSSLISQDIDTEKPLSGAGESESPFRLVLENAPVGMAILSSDNKINLINKAFCRLLGYTQQEMLLNPFQSFCSSDDLDRIYQKQQQLRDGRIEDFQMGKKFICKNGQSISTIMKMALNPGTSGSSAEFILQIVDITNRKEYEEHLKHRNEYLEKLNAELDRFVYSASHDLRAPLRSILGLVYIMQKEDGSEPLHIYLDMIIGSINRLDRFIKDVIDHSKNSRLDIKSEKVDMHTLVSEIFEDMQYINGAEKIEKIIEIDDSRELYSDAGRLKVALSNLIANAMTYHKPDQDNPFVKVTLKFDNTHSIITVEDNGSGISEEYHEKIFEMFFRASEDTKGSGLGLYIVKETVEKLGGTIALHSAPNRGTTFTVTVPNMNDNSK
jgi:PAS domain S-box-containing protein